MFTESFYCLTLSQSVILINIYEHLSKLYIQYYNIYYTISLKKRAEYFKGKTTGIPMERKRIKVQIPHHVD